MTDENPAFLWKSQETPGIVVQSPLVAHIKKCEKEAAFFMANQVMRITLKAYDHELIDQAAKDIVEAVKSSGAKVSGPVPMPTKVEKVTILRAVHSIRIVESSSSREHTRDSSMLLSQTRRQSMYFVKSISQLVYT